MAKPSSLGPAPEFLRDGSARAAVLRFSMMLNRREFVAAASGALADRERNPLEPHGRIHIPIGLPDELDTLKTFVEAEGPFSPGFGTYGISFRLVNGRGQALSGTSPEVTPARGLLGNGLPMPWVRWEAWGVEVLQELCQAEGVVVVRLTIRGSVQPLKLVASLRALGPAGGPVYQVEAAPDALIVDGHAALLARTRPSASRGTSSAKGDGEGELEFDVPAGKSVFGFVCPVRAGRKAARHHWVDRRQNALVDDAPLDSGDPQPDPGIEHWRKVDVDSTFKSVADYWEEELGRFQVRVPDARWAESMRAILAHASLTMNDGAPDVAVVNYNVFNRDGVYVANMMQKAGWFELSEAALDYFLAHPFNGRAYPEADNPGQILWSLSEHYRYTRDRKWLARIYPQAEKLAEMIEYYRTAAGPHRVSMSRIAFGDELKPAEGAVLEPGRCDGLHPEYTEAFDVAGLRAFSALALAAGEADDAMRWRELATSLFEQYDRKFGAALAKQYGSYSVLWPCALYPFRDGAAHQQFRSVGARKPGGWRYFPLATAHQGLLAGNREAGWGTLKEHLAHEQMHGWYAFDEGGGSASGGWQKVRTNWPRSIERPGDNLSVAMPHGWAIAEFWLLMRDSLVHEDGSRLILFAGVPPEWLDTELYFSGMNTYWGPLTVRWRDGKLETEGAKPPGGIVLAPR